MDESFVEGDRDSQSRVIGKRGGGMDFDAVAGDVEFRVSGARAVGAGENGGANVGSAGGKNDAGAGGFDGHVPLIAGNVPVELVVIVEKFDGVGDGVLDGDGLDGVIGVGDVDFEFAVVADAAGIEFEVVAAAVGDIFHAEKERVVQALRSAVFDGDGTIQAVPGAADEVGFDFFGDVDGAVAGDDDVGIEVFDAQFFGACGGGTSERDDG